MIPVGGRFFSWDSLWVLVSASSAVLVRASLGYRPFPSIDDFAYVPLAWHWLDPAFYPRDAILGMFVNHQLAYTAIVAVGDLTRGLASAFLLATLLLTAFTVFGVARIMRALGATGLFVPVALGLSAAVVVRGLGRGSYDGLVGDGVHGEWVAIVLSLFAFDALLRGKDLASGLMLGLAAYAHPMLAFHSAFSVAVAGIWAGRASLRRTARVAVTAFLTGMPLMITLGLQLHSEGASHAVAGFNAIEDGYLFRLPHEYTLDFYPAALMLLLAVIGAGGLATFADLQRVRDRYAVGLYVGLALILVFSFLAYGTGAGRILGRHEVVLYMLGFTRSSPLLMTLSAVFVAVAFEKGLAGETRAEGGALWNIAIWTAMLLSFAMLLFLNMRHDMWIAGALMLSLVTVLVYRRALNPQIIAAAWLAAGGMAAVSFATTVEVTGEPPVSDHQLYAWSSSATPSSALFLIPPGLTEFRLRTKRSVYVDFKLMPPAQPAQMQEWRRRIELVAQPDRLALAARGWPAMDEWDRTYASRNTPTRIRWLLRTTGADYFVFNKAGLNMPPYVDQDRRMVPGLAIAYQNAQYVVYRLTAAERRKPEPRSEG